MSSESLSSIAQTVRGIIGSFAQGTGLPEHLPDDLLLMDDGLGFDSIRVVELLFVCEEEFGVTITTEITEDTVIDVGTIVTLINREVGRRLKP